MTPPRSEGYVRMPDAEFEAILTRAAEDPAPDAEEADVMRTSRPGSRLQDAAPPTERRPRRHLSAAERVDRMLHKHSLYFQNGALAKFHATNQN